MHCSRKIIFLNRFFAPDHSATSQLLSDLAVDLARRGMPVHVITSRMRYDDPLDRLPSEETVDAVQVHRVWSSRFGRHFLPGRAIDYLTFHLSAALMLFRWARPKDLVVVLTDPPLLAVTQWPVIRLRHASLLTWNQDVFPEVATLLGVRPLGRQGIRLLQRWRNHTWQQASRNVVLGDRMAERLRSEAVPPERIRVIHNWSDGQSIIPISAGENPLRTAWGLTDFFVVGYSGNLGRAHELDTLLAAAEQLKQHPRIRFLFIGGGAGQARLAARIKTAQLTNILLQPYQPRAMLPYSLTLPDIHWLSLLPSLEGLIVPSKWYGILAAGRPTLYIGDQQGEIPPLLQAAGCGVTCSVGDSQAVARQLVAWADNPRLCQQMGEAARQLFMERFDRTIALTAWHQLIQDASR
ncbi:MAG: glycosyltransferase family 4 protein [Magnetococcales bacterium]|nr:glycosyltransferase family 4 protein [Magnetococcales bacterium]